MICLKIVEFGSREKLYGLSTLVLRLGLGIVFLWFGIDKFTNTAANAAMFQNTFYATLVPNASVAVLLVGIVECIVGAALVLGMLTRLAALVAALQLIAIMTAFGVDNLVRDIGLLAAAVSLFITGSPLLGMDARKKRDKWKKH